MDSLPESVLKSFTYKTYIKTVNRYFDENEEISNAEIYIENYENINSNELYNFTTNDIKFNKKFVENLFKTKSKKYVSFIKFKKLLKATDIYSKEDKEILLDMITIFVNFIADNLNILAAKNKIDKLNDKLANMNNTSSSESSQSSQSDQSDEYDKKSLKSNLSNDLSSDLSNDLSNDLPKKSVKKDKEKKEKKEKPNDTNNTLALINKNSLIDKHINSKHKPNSKEKCNNEITEKYFVLRSVAYVSYDDNGSYTYLWKIINKLPEVSIEKDGIHFNDFKEYSTYYKNSGVILEHNYLWDRDIYLTKKQIICLEQLLFTFDNLFSAEIFDRIFDIVSST